MLLLKALAVGGGERGALLRQPRRIGVAQLDHWLVEHVFGHHLLDQLVDELRDWPVETRADMHANPVQADIRW